MTEIFKTLRKTKLLTFKNLLVIAKEIFKGGINIGLLIRVASVLYTNRIAITFNKRSISYAELLDSTNKIAFLLKEHYQLKQGNKIAIACTNHPIQISTILAAGYLGLDIYLLPSELKEDKFQELLSLYKFDFVVYDKALDPLIQKVGYPEKSSVTYGAEENSIEEYLASTQKISFVPKRHFKGKVVVLTAGTTGVPKLASRKVKAENYFSPFVDLLNTLELEKYTTVFIATPIYHGFGLSTMFISLLLGQHIYITDRFNAEITCQIIQNNQIECIALVPTVLQRLMSYDVESLKSLHCIISGGAILTSKVVKEVQIKLGDILYNLYGTSEAGFCIMAKPNDLKYNPNTIGKPIHNVKVRISSKVEGELGELILSCKWSSCSGQWINTGDLAYVDKNGYYFLKGRVDDMIVSGGENVYPHEIELCLLKHPRIEEVVAIAVPDEDLGQRMKIFVVSDVSLDADELMLWMREKLARYQLPKEIAFVQDIPKNAIGKVDRKSLDLFEL